MPAHIIFKDAVVYFQMGSFQLCRTCSDTYDCSVNDSTQASSLTLLEVVSASLEAVLLW